MTSTPDVLGRLAAAGDALTPAKIAKIRTSVETRLSRFESAQATLDTIRAAMEVDAASLAVSEPALTTARAAATTKETARTAAVARVAELQAAIAEGRPPASAEDVEERDEIVALAAEVGVTLP